MAINFEKWNKDFGGEIGKKALAEAKENSFKELPEGDYIGKLKKMELAESKQGKPMIKAMFRITDGRYRKQCLFVNQVVTDGFPMHKGLEFLRSLKVFAEDEIEFTGDYAELNDLILDIAENAEGLTFEISKEMDGDYSRYTITDVFEA